MKLLVISQNPNFIGGANRSLLEVTTGLVKQYGVECTFIVPKKGEFINKNRNGSFYIFKYYQCGLYRGLFIKTVLRYIRFIYMDLFNRISAKIASFLIKDKFDCIYINDTSNTFGYYLAKNMRLPYVWHFRNFNSNTVKYMFFEKSFRKHDNNRIIAISNSMKNHMVKNRGIDDEKITVVYNGLIPLENVDYVPYSSKIEKGIHILLCGTIFVSKRQDLAIKAVNLLKKQGIKNIYLHLVGPIGNCKYFKYLNKLVKEYNLENIVLFEGSINNMIDFRKNMAIELMCSKEEAFGRVTVEGMQQGLVLIGSNSGGTPEIISDEFNGLLFNQGDYVDLANKIFKVISNIKYSNLISKNAFIFSKNHFTSQHNIESIYTVLDDVVKKSMNGCKN